MRSEKGNMCGMIKDDRIYQVLLKYNFDLFRGDKNITEYMREHCNQFYCDICDALKGGQFLSWRRICKSIKWRVRETSRHLLNHTRNP